MAHNRVGNGGREPIARLSEVCFEDDILALDGVDLDMRAGELHILIGGTNSGHATILRMLLGLVVPDTGSVTVFGHEPRSEAARQRLGAVLFGTYLPPAMRVHEIVDLVRSHYHDTLSTAETLAQFGAEDLAGSLAETLDQGQDRWVSVALAFCGKPDLVVLDQPTAGMDFDWRLMLWQRLRNFTESGGTVMMNTHFISEAEAFADRVSVVAGGKIVADGTPEEIKAKGNRRRIFVKTDSDLDFGADLEVERLEDGQATIYTDDSDATVRRMIQAGVDFGDLRIDQGSLQDAVVTLTGNRDE